MVRILQIFLVLVCMLDVCVGQQWSPAGATWYGPPNGAGTDGNIFIYIYTQPHAHMS